MSARARITILIALNAALVTLLLSSPGRTGLPQRYGDPGTFDFIQYWTAHALMVNGQNPYDPALMLGAQRALGFSGSIAVRMVSPPWHVVLLDPILRFPFFVSASIWLVLSLLFAAFAGALTTVAYRGRLVLSRATLLATFAFQPIASNLWFGQMGLLHALSIAGFLCFVGRERQLTAGLMLVPLSVKPHLTYLVWLLLAYWVIRQRAWPVAVSFGTGLAALVGITWFLHPHSLAQWVDATARRAPLNYIPSTLVGKVRELIFAHTGEAARWPLVVIPAVTALGLGMWLVARRPVIDLRRWLPPVLAVSLFTSPYGWVFDQSQLVLIQVALVALAEREGVELRVRWRVWLALASVQLAVLVAYALGQHEMQDFFWVGLALALVWFYGTRELEQAASTAGTCVAAQ